MDPITLIVTALVAGASGAAREAAGEAVKDAYHGLKALIQRRFQGNRAAEVALEQHAQDPETWEQPLRKELEKAGAADDKELVAAAKALLERVQPAGAGRDQNTVVGADVDVGEHGQFIAGGNVGVVDINTGRS